MDSLEDAVHSFVIRLWCEERDSLTQALIWRGHITHVASQQRRYVQSLDEIKTIIKEFLRDPDSRFTPG